MKNETPAGISEEYPCDPSIAAFVQVFTTRIFRFLRRRKLSDAVLPPEK
jgi:hypothetical protein